MLREESKRTILTTASWQVQKRLLYLENSEEALVVNFGSIL